MIVLKNVRVPDDAWYFEITFRTVEDKEQITIGGIIKDQIEDAAIELEKANKTIEELMKINSELAADNNNITKARRKIMELEIRNGRLEKERDKYKYKLIHRDEHFKELMKESILELIEERWRP